MPSLAQHMPLRHTPPMPKGRKTASSPPAAPAKTPRPEDVRIGARVRAMMEADGLTQTQLADRMRTVQSEISKLLAGERQWTATWIKKAADALERRPWQITGAAEEPAELMLLEKYRGLSEQDRGAVSTIVDSLMRKRREAYRSPGGDRRCRATPDQRSAIAPPQSAARRRSARGIQADLEDAFPGGDGSEAAARARDIASARSSDSSRVLRFSRQRCCARSS